MSTRAWGRLGPVALLLPLLACSQIDRLHLQRRTGGSGALYGQFRAYDGRNGRPLSFAEVARRAGAADVILFGESHSDTVCNQLEAQLLAALADSPRPVALAMEFFEADTQAAVDAYLRGRIDEEAFREQTRQKRAYVLSHRPLIEMCRAGRIPVVAANAPRRLVSDYRKSGVGYEVYRAGLDPEEQRWLPVTNEKLSGPYRSRFYEVMGGTPDMPAEKPAMPPASTQPASAPASPHAMPTSVPVSQPATQPTGGMPGHMDIPRLYQAQLLWDQAMAESLAAFREDHPWRRVMLIVGSFHVAHTGGTAAKFQWMRPDDRVLTIVYGSTPDEDLEFDPEDRGAGDIVIYGIEPPPVPPKSDVVAGAGPTSLPVHPATLPSATQPTNGPTTPDASTPDSQPVAVKPAVPNVLGAGEELFIRHVLALKWPGRSGRFPVSVDAVQDRIVRGEWTPPSAGEIVRLPDAQTRTWTELSADEENRLRDPMLQGGYVYALVTSAIEQVMLLEARGHSFVYVNSEPRAGDPYQTGFVRLPVQLRAGANHLLFGCGRGELQARLLPATTAVLFNRDDRTLPDLLVGEAVDTLGALVLINADTRPLCGAVLTASLGDVSTASVVATIPPLGIHKAGFSIVGAAPPAGEEQSVELVLADAEGVELTHETIQLRVRKPDESHRRTFRSGIDGSVQYYGVQPQVRDGDREGPPALFLTLHGAGVEALHQASCYQPKDWGVVVAPTNRRPYGFDWEDWGRRDALEVLAIAQETFGTDPRRTYLTGHSMGGHGTWQLGAHYPDRFAAIAPSAGWISFWSYTGAFAAESVSPMEALLLRAMSPSDTLKLSRNYLQSGIYILHGDQDDNVPVDQARQMRTHLAAFHPNFAYYEQPGAGHWWGNQCMDWPPLFDFLARNSTPAAVDVRHIEFVTSSPAVSATCHWVTIVQQREALKPSRVDLRMDPQGRAVTGTTENVALLEFDFSAMPPNEPATLELDGQALGEFPHSELNFLAVVQHEGKWEWCEPAALGQGPVKTPRRSGPFKLALDNEALLVYGTQGTPAESAWALAKARFDAETFWYRGNGAFEVMADADFDPAANADRNVILYGNRETNAAWMKLDLPRNCDVARDAIQVGDRLLRGGDFALLAVLPRPDSETALVGVVGGSGIIGMRLTERLPYFISGVAYPDWIVLGADVLRDGTCGIRGAGFFGNDWQVDPRQSAWQLDTHNGNWPDQ